MLINEKKREREYQAKKYNFQMIVVKAPCPRLEKALKEAYVNDSKSAEFPSSKYFQELSNYTGQNISTITDIEFLYNTLEIEERNGLKLPEWTIKYYNRQMREIAARSLSLFTSNTLQQRLRGGIKIVKDPKTFSYYNLIFICIYSFFFLGPLLKEILERMNSFNNNQDTRRAYFYSAHDITLVNLLRTMGFTDEYFKPEYGSTLIFQLHAGSNSTEDMELKVILTILFFFQLCLFLLKFYFTHPLSLNIFFLFLFSLFTVDVSK